MSGHTISDTAQAALSTWTLGQSNIADAATQRSNNVNTFIKGMTTPPSAPNLQSPDAITSTPTESDAASTALKAELTNEQQQASTSAYLTGGQGLLDQPNTTSRILLGN